MQHWHEPVSDREAANRAGGRRRYNAQRQDRARHRAQGILNLFFAGYSRAEIARRVGVHRSTVGRTIRHIIGSKRVPLPYRYGYTAEWRPERGWRVKKPPANETW